MDLMLYASLYDHRWLAFGWPKLMGYFDIHQDVLTSNLFYAVAYLETQMLTLTLMYSSTEDKLEFTGLQYFIDAFSPQEKNQEDPTKIKTILQENQKDSKYAYVEVFGYRIKELKLMGHLQILRTMFLVITAVQVKFKERKWFKDVFDKNQATGEMHAAVFTPDQMHRISAFSIRQSVFFGPLLSAPFTVPSHYSFALSFVCLYFYLFKFTDPLILACFMPDRFFAGFLWFEFCLTFLVRFTVVFMAYNKTLVLVLHDIKKWEAWLNAKIKKTLWHRKSPVLIESIPINKQPWVEDGMIRCGDPSCKLMHKRDELVKQQQQAQKKTGAVDAAKKKK